MVTDSMSQSGCHDLIKKMPPANVAKVIEDLMLEPPSGLRK